MSGWILHLLFLSWLDLLSQWSSNVKGQFTFEIKYLIRRSIVIFNPKVFIKLPIDELHFNAYLIIKLPDTSFDDIPSADLSGNLRDAKTWLGVLFCGGPWQKPKVLKGGQMCNDIFDKSITQKLEWRFAVIFKRHHCQWSRRQWPRKIWSIVLFFKDTWNRKSDQSQYSEGAHYTANGNPN